MRWTLLTGAGRGRRGRRRRDRGRARARQHRRPAASARRRARAARPTAEAKADAWRKASSSDDGLANQTVAAVGIGFGRAHDPQLLAPYVERYHDALLDGVGSAAPTPSPSRSSSCSTRSCWPASELADATQAWLDAHADAPAGLRRLVGENRDGITRALAAQERDAARG